MRRDDGGASGRAMIDEQAYEVPLRRRVNLGRRFVGKDNVRRKRERDREPHARGLSAR